MSVGKKLNEAATATPNPGDKLLMIQDGQIKAAEIGTQDGMIPRIVGIPPLPTLVADGYLPSTAQPNDRPVYIEGMLRYLVDKYNTGGFYMGPINMGSQGFYVAFLYNYNVNGLPSYCNGFFLMHGMQNIGVFGTNNGVFWINYTN